MTSPVTGNSNSGSALGETMRRGDIMGKDEFLKLLVTQLKNQDPMNPQDGKDMAAQLAQFSSVEQLIEIGKKIDAQGESLAEAQAAMKTSSDTTFAASLLGKTVLRDGKEVEVVKGAPTTITADFPSGVAGADVRILDAKGKEVFRTAFADVKSGRTSLELPANDLAPGTYTYEITAKDADGKVKQVRPLSGGTVTGMGVSDGTVMLRIGGKLVKMSDVIEIRAAAPSTNTTTGATVP